MAVSKENEVVWLNEARGHYGKWLARALEARGIRTGTDLRHSGVKWNLYARVKRAVRGEYRKSIRPQDRDELAGIVGDREGEQAAYLRQFGDASRVFYTTDSLTDYAQGHGIYCEYLAEALEGIGIRTLGDLRYASHPDGLTACVVRDILRRKFRSVKPSSRARLGRWLGDPDGNESAYAYAVEMGEYSRTCHDVVRRREEPDDGKGADWWLEKQESLRLGRGNPNHDKCPRCGHEFDGEWGWCAACGMGYHPEKDTEAAV